MEVKLISYTQLNPEMKPELGIGDTIQDIIAYVARVSNPNNQTNPNSGKLIEYLMKHSHWSPFELVSATVMITTTRDIGRQILRHRSFAFQEFSQRYADPTKDMDFVIREARLQDTKNRQNSIEIENDPNTQGNQELADTIMEWGRRQAAVRNLTKDTYKWAVDHGIAKEQARVVLPEGITVSKLYMAGSLRSWIHLIQVRHHPATQKEFRLIAAEIMAIIIDLMPCLREPLTLIVENNYKSESSH
jgi:thymidylate synthase (FAD)